jgi:hypothetical protein
MIFFEKRRIPDKNDRCAFTRGSRGEVMIFLEKNKRAGVKKVFIHVYTLIVYLCDRVSKYKKPWEITDEIIN